MHTFLDIEEIKHAFIVPFNSILYALYCFNSARILSGRILAVEWIDQIEHGHAKSCVRRCTIALAAGSALKWQSVYALALGERNFRTRSPKLRIGVALLLESDWTAKFPGELWFDV